ncbi:hypothetical protein LSAT2_024470, partial [Lamellibrachia satsuma]
IHADDMLRDMVVTQELTGLRNLDSSTAPSSSSQLADRYHHRCRFLRGSRGVTDCGYSGHHSTCKLALQRTRRTWVPTQKSCCCI